MEKKKMCFKKKYVVLFIILLVAFFLVVGSALIWAAGGGGGIFHSDYYTSTHGQTKVVLDVASNKVQTVINASSKDYFVPNKTAAEWNSFAANLPANVTLGVVTCDYEDFQCGSDCSYNGFTYRTAAVGSQCWFADDLRASQSASGTNIVQWPANTSYAASDRFSCLGQYNNCTSTNESLFYQISGLLPDGGVASGTLVGVRGMCPNGWHVPSAVEIDTTFKTTVGSCYKSAYSLYDANCLNNSYGLNIVMRGYRRNDAAGGPFYSTTTCFSLRTASSDGVQGPPWYAGVCRNFTPNGSNSPCPCYDGYGLSARCIKN